jgi:L-ribulose-5-phosphate 4-epimerase
MTKESVEGDYELETGKQITSHFHRESIDPNHCPMTLVAGHGPFAWGENAAKALYHGVVLEQIAQMAWITEELGRKERLPSYYVQKHFMRKHGSDAYYGQTDGD